MLHNDNVILIVITEGMNYVINCIFDPIHQALMLLKIKCYLKEI